MAEMKAEVKLIELVEKMNLKNLTPDIDLTEKVLTVPDINRPALQLTGYFDYFESERVQVIGYVEYTYLEGLAEERKKEILDVAEELFIAKGYDNTSTTDILELKIEN